MLTTYTRTHVEISFANPHLMCTACGAQVTRWHKPSACGCRERTWNSPCGCSADTESLCPAWSPVDGCACLKTYGVVGHPVPDRERHV